MTVKSFRLQALDGKRANLIGWGIKDLPRVLISHLRQPRDVVPILEDLRVGRRDDEGDDRPVEGVLTDETKFRTEGQKSPQGVVADHLPIAWTKP